MDCTHVIYFSSYSVFFITTYFTTTAFSKVALRTDVKKKKKKDSLQTSSSKTLPLPVPAFVSGVPLPADRAEAMSQGAHAWLLYAAL